MGLPMAGRLAASGLPVTAAAREFLDATCAAGFGDAGFGSVARVLRDKASQG